MPEPDHDCHLLFPPPWSLLHTVHLSTPLLLGHLLREGFDARQTDLNVEAANRLLTPGVARDAEARLSRRLDALERAGAPEAAREPVEEALSTGSLVADAIEDACAALREAVDRPRAVGWASQVVRLHGDLVSAAFAPTMWRPLSGEYRSAELARRFTIGEALASLDRAERDPVERAIDEAVAEAVADGHARLYGISVACSEQLYPALRCALWLRAHRPGARIALGGAGIPFVKEAILGERRVFDLVDFVVIGDGEEPLRALVAAARGEGGLDEVPNLWRVRTDGRVIEPRSPWQAGFAPPAPPRFDGVPLERYFTRPALPLLAGRRCYWNRCTFCAITYDKSTAFGPTQAAEVAAAMEDVVRRTGQRTFSFVDEAVSAPQLRRLSSAIRERGLDVVWDAMVRFEKKLDRETLEASYGAGLRAIYYGLESGSQKVVDLMEKGYDLAVAERCLCDASEAGIWTSAFIMVGFPGEDEADLEDTLAFCRRNRAHLDALGAGAFEVHKISPVAQDPARFGLTLGALPEGGLEHRLPQPGRETLLRERAARFSREIEDDYRHLELYGVHAGNLLQHLGRIPKAELYRRIEEAEATVLAERRRVTAAGPTARLRLADGVRVGAERDGAVSVLCASTGACVRMPSEVVARARRGTSLASLFQALASMGEDPRYAIALIELGVLTRAEPVPA